MLKAELKICPSILAGDFAHLEKEVRRLEEAGVELLHIDVMDGHFVPNLTFGPMIVEAINRSTEMFLDVHLMMYNPYNYIEKFVEAGADQVTFHFEATEDVDDTLEYVRRCNVKAGLAFCPETSQDMIPKYLTRCDTLLLMTVHPGFGGQSFMPQVLDKIRFARECCNKRQIRQGGIVVKDSKSKVPLFDIQVDGGINQETSKLCVEAGANMLVTGTYLFQAPSLKGALLNLKKGCEPFLEHI